ncbi:hypothetical protein QBC47DRAFT_62632 [Echria macrotheca]|uniref:Uncharacterized protein n=1 Tax=Echria macrotheca TaxID=438768 RepID=A0AAJ0B8L4_9PEZI|nr:hypothetical protein QBC47DRAFT_62632 [Echria macrotheca]
MPDLDDHITLRLKYGIHTIFLFVEPQWTFSKLTHELVDILRDRYPDGLRSKALGTAIPIPEPGNEVRIAYALPKTPNDLEGGWTNLKAAQDDTLTSKGLRDNTAVAFALVDAEEDPNDVEFIVDIPVYDVDDGNDAE